MRQRAVDVAEDIREFFVLEAGVLAVRGGFQKSQKRLSVIASAEEAEGVFNHEGARPQREEDVDGCLAYGVSAVEIPRGSSLCAGILRG